MAGEWQRNDSVYGSVILTVGCGKMETLLVWLRNVGGPKVISDFEPKEFSVLKPISEAHSIESISLICEFSGEVDGNGLAAVKNDAVRLKSRFPIRRTMRKARPDAHDPQTPSADVVGHVYINKSSDKEVSRFDIFQNRASFTSKVYTDFNSFFAEAAFTMSIAYQAFSKSGHNLDKIVLSYTDYFVANDIDWAIEEALNPETKYIAQACLKKGEFWHSQIGVFDRDQPDSLPLLHNIKAGNLLMSKDTDFEEEDSEDKYVLSLELLHVQKVDEVKSANEFNSVLEKIAQALRTHHKVILGDILSPEMATRIGLVRKEGRLA